MDKHSLYFNSSLSPLPMADLESGLAASQQHPMRIYLSRDLSTYESRKHVGVTGTLWSWIFGDDGYDTAYEPSIVASHVSLSLNLNEEPQFVRPMEEPIAYALLASTRAILDTVNSLAGGIRSWLGWAAEERQVETEAAVPFNNDESVIIDMAPSNSPPLTPINPAAKEKKTLQEPEETAKAVPWPLEEEEEEEEEAYDEGFWEQRSSSSISQDNFYGTESYIDTSQDDTITERPIAKRRQAPVKLKVRFDPLVLLMNAAMENEIDAVKKFISSKVYSVNQVDAVGYCLLHYAASSGHADMVKYLLKQGANANQLEQEQWSPLHFATIAGKIKVVKILLDAGANVDIINVQGYLADQLTEDKKIIKCIQEIRKKKMAAKKVRALYDWTASFDNELSIRKGMNLKVLERQENWWLVQDDDKNIGTVPRIFVQ